MDMNKLTHPSPNYSRRVRDVVSVCLHWTGGTYKSAVDWCTRDEAKVSYHAIVGRDGEVAILVKPDFTAWSVGPSKAPPPWEGTAGNSMTYNIGLAGGPSVPPTEAQKLATARLVASANKYFGLSAESLTDHAMWAWPRGRKSDASGQGWLSLGEIRGLLDEIV